MDFNVFPSNMKEKLSIEMKKEIDSVEKNRNNALKIANEKMERPLSDSYLITGGIVGFVLGLLINRNNKNPLPAVFLIVLISIIIGKIIHSMVVSKTNDYNDESRYRTTEVNKTYDVHIQIIEEKYNDKMDEFTKKFEDCVQEKSVKFADSELAKEVIDWMFNGFSNTIEKADRSIHIKVLDIPFKFKVFQNRISCNLGQYDFKVHRCENLQNPIDQSALARAIASSIQLKLVMQYSVDPSGTKASAELINNYGSDYIESTIRYIADNGNYQEVKKW